MLQVLLVNKHPEVRRSCSCTCFFLIFFLLSTAQDKNPGHGFTIILNYNITGELQLHVLVYLSGLPVVIQGIHTLGVGAPHVV